ncbi:MAG: cyclase family protein [Bacteroidota bacterium]
MCVPACQKKIAQALSRRHFLRSAGIGSLGVMAASCAPAASTEPAQQAPQTLSYSRVVDLTHVLGEQFPAFSGQQQVTIEQVSDLNKDGYNMNRWTIVEHTGTHLDAPFHFSDQQTADNIPVADLVGQVAVIDIRAKAADNPDAQLTPEDIKAWEATHGELPSGVIVAMNSGWDAYVNGPKFRNADDDGGLHFPGFHVEATSMLMEERSVKGILVDTLSLDHGPSPDFAVHFSWLPSNRWGVECVANLGDLPPIGATVIVGGPKIQGATGGPSRVIALV